MSCTNKKLCKNEGENLLLFKYTASRSYKLNKDGMKTMQKGIHFGIKDSSPLNSTLFLKSKSNSWLANYDFAS